MNWIKQELLLLIQKIETAAVSAWDLLIAFIKEAVKEEEAALWPLVKAQASQLLLDEAKTAGLTVQGRVTMAVTEITAALAIDGTVAASTLLNAYVWAVAHSHGLVDGNQGVVS